MLHGCNIDNESVDIGEYRWLSISIVLLTLLDREFTSLCDKNPKFTSDETANGEIFFITVHSARYSNIYDTQLCLW